MQKIIVRQNTHKKKQADTQTIKKPLQNNYTAATTNNKHGFIWIVIDKVYLGILNKHLQGY